MMAPVDGLRPGEDNRVIERIVPEQVAAPQTHTDEELPKLWAAEQRTLPGGTTGPGTKTMIPPAAQSTSIRGGNPAFTIMEQLASGARIPYWRESHFFALHHPGELDDALVLTMASQPSRQLLDSFQLGTINGVPFFQRHFRRCSDPREMMVGPVQVEVVEPYRRLRLRAVADGPSFGMDILFTARTAPYLMGWGELWDGSELVWRQRQIVQSGWFDGTYAYAGKSYAVRRWWGQRDHSWGVRNHVRAPMWLWLAIQLPDGMLGAWCWERADGSRCYTDGCWAQMGDAEPVRVTSVDHNLDWLDDRGRPMRYGSGGQGVHGLSGRVQLGLGNHGRVTVDGHGVLVARYGRRGGGLFQMSVRTDDGRSGTAIYEITGRRHHWFFPATS